MKKQLSSLDLHFLLKELEALKGSRVDKVYHPEKSLLIFSFYKANAGKKILKIIIGQALFIADEKEGSETLGFGMLLRKHLDGSFLADIIQIKPERILKLAFQLKDAEKALYVEFFGKGNAILCDENDIIINSLEHHEFKDRTIKPKIQYKYPIMKHNFFGLDSEGLADLLKNSKKDTLVTCLAVELGLGGIYSEEVCLLSGIDKNINPKNIDEKQAASMLPIISGMSNKKIEPLVIYHDDKIIDFTPFELRLYKGHSKKEFPTFSEALSFFYSRFRETKETELDAKLRNLQRIIEEQKHSLEELKKEEKELRGKGELIYHKYSLIREILEEINKASKKYKWGEIKEKLKGHKVVKELNEKERKVIVEID